MSWMSSAFFGDERDFNVRLSGHSADILCLCAGLSRFQEILIGECQTFL